MAIVKHIKSRNANYSAAINYLLFEHDEKTGKKIVDESGRSILRKEFYMDGLNCDPMSFDKECELTNAHFHKNKKHEDIKSHHYIISYDPADVTENGLTGEKAQAISLELAKQMFPGYQALVVTHTGGHNESGNIHIHIVINSVRKDAVERQSYMDKPHEEAAGYKHRSTDKFMNAFKKTVVERCQQEGLHQIDLLALAERKITQKEYMTQKPGQQKLYEINQKIIQDGLKPTSTVFLTQGSVGYSLRQISPAPGCKSPDKCEGNADTVCSASVRSKDFQTYNSFPSSYAFFITSTWLAAVFAASIPPPLTMPFKEAFSKQSAQPCRPL